MNTHDVQRLFRTIDDMNADAFVSFFTPEGAFKFGNSPAVRGKAAVHGLVDGFWKSIAGSQHKLLHLWNDGDDVAVHGEVTYTRKDNKLVTVSFVNVFKMKGDKIDSYLIHIDNGPLFAP
jgi:hypothetical protein